MALTLDLTVLLFYLPGGEVGLSGPGGAIVFCNTTKVCTRIAPPGRYRVRPPRRGGKSKVSGMALAAGVRQPNDCYRLVAHEKQIFNSGQVGDVFGFDWSREKQLFGGSAQDRFFIGFGQEINVVPNKLDRSRVCVTLLDLVRTVACPH